MTEKRDLAGRRAVVTGGSRGLGRAVSERLARGGAQVHIVDLPDALGEVPSGWGATACDLSDIESRQTLQALAEDLGRVDIVVANAGVVPPWRGVDQLDDAEWQHVMAVNVWGVAVTIGAFAAALEASGHGSAICMASINGYKAHPKQVLYSASKHAVIGLMRSAALDLGSRGIRVNALAPGAIATEALLARVKTRHSAGGPAPDAALRALADEAALGRLATAEDVANVAHFLASDASQGMTGSVFPVEAGLA